LNILFITSTRIGDAVLSTSLLDHVIRTHPGARVTIACGPAAAPLFEAVPGLSRIIVMRKRRAALHWLDLWCQVVPKAWSVVVDLRASAIAWLLIADERRVFRPRPAERVHRMVQLGRVFDLPVPPSPHLWTASSHEVAAASIIPTTPVLALGPTANWRGKTWRAERFAALVERLTGRDGILPNAPVAAFGAPNEREAARPVLEAIPAARRIDLVGHAELLTVYACLKRCAFYVGNDSGLMHIAAAANIPTLGLFGPSRAENYAPWGDKTAVVQTAIPYDDLFGPGYDHRKTDTLMDSLSLDAVVEAAESLWRRTHAPAGAQAVKP
jgi:ADP-heptose:LPS heptosyltransferase